MLIKKYINGQWVNIASNRASDIVTTNTTLIDSGIQQPVEGPTTDPIPSKNIKSSTIEKIMLKQNERIDKLEHNVSWLAKHGGGGSSGGGGSLGSDVACKVGLLITSESADGSTIEIVNMPDIEKGTLPPDIYIDKTTKIKFTYEYPTNRYKQPWHITIASPPNTVKSVELYGAKSKEIILTYNDLLPYIKGSSVTITMSGEYNDEQNMNFGFIPQFTITMYLANIVFETKDSEIIVSTSDLNKVKPEIHYSVGKLGRYVIKFSLKNGAGIQIGSQKEYTLIEPFEIKDRNKRTLYINPSDIFDKAGVTDPQLSYTATLTLALDEPDTKVKAELPILITVSSETISVISPVMSTDQSKPNKIPIDTNITILFYCYLDNANEFSYTVSLRNHVSGATAQLTTTPYTGKFNIATNASFVIPGGFIATGQLYDIVLNINYNNGQQTAEQTYYVIFTEATASLCDRYDSVQRNNVVIDFRAKDYNEDVKDINLTVNSNYNTKEGHYLTHLQSHKTHALCGIKYNKNDKTPSYRVTNDSWMTISGTVFNDVIITTPPPVTIPPSTTTTYYPSTPDTTTTTTWDPSDTSTTTTSAATTLTARRETKRVNSYREYYPNLIQNKRGYTVYEPSFRSKARFTTQNINYSDYHEFTISLAFKADEFNEVGHTVMFCGSQNSLMEQSGGILIDTRGIYIGSGSKVWDLRKSQYYYIVLSQEIMRSTTDGSDQYVFTVFVNGCRTYSTASKTRNVILGDKFYFGGIPNSESDGEFNIKKQADFDLYSFTLYNKAINDYDVMIDEINNKAIANYVDGHPNYDIIQPMLNSNGCKVIDGKIESNLYNIEQNKFTINKLLQEAEDKKTFVLNESAVAELKLPIPIMHISFAGQMSTNWTLENFLTRYEAGSSAIMPKAMGVKMEYIDPELTDSNNRPKKINSAVNVSLQGTSTLSDALKNLDVEFPVGEDGYGTLFFPNDRWLPEQTYTLKADIVDSAHANNPAIGRFVNEILGATSPTNAKNAIFDMNEMAISNFYSEFRDKYMPNANLKHTVEGFPILLMCTFYKSNTETRNMPIFLGIYSFNLGRNAYRNLGFTKIRNIIKRDNQPALSPNQSYPCCVVDARVEETENLGAWIEIGGTSSGLPEEQRINMVKYNTLYGDSKTNKPEDLGTALAGIEFWQNDQTIISTIFETRYPKSSEFNIENISNPLVGKFYNFVDIIMRLPIESCRRTLSNEDKPRILDDIAPTYPICVRNDRGYEVKMVGGKPAMVQPLTKNEVPSTLPFNRTSILKYFTICMLFGIKDNFGKNMTFRAWRSEADKNDTSAFSQFYAGLYDLDTSFDNGNQGELDTNPDFWYHYIANMKIPVSVGTGHYALATETYLNNNNKSAGLDLFNEPENRVPSSASSKLLLSIDTNFWYNDLEIKETLGSVYIDMMNQIDQKLQEYNAKNGTNYDFVDWFMNEYFIKQTEGCGSLIYNYDYSSKYYLMLNTDDGDEEQKPGAGSNKRPINIASDALKKLHGRKIESTYIWMQDHVAFLDTMMYFRDIARTTSTEPYITRKGSTFIDESLETVVYKTPEHIPFIANKYLMLYNRIGDMHKAFAFLPKDKPIPVYMGNNTSNSELKWTYRNASDIYSIGGDDSIPLSNLNLILSSLSGVSQTGGFGFNRKITQFNLAGQQQLSNAFKTSLEAFKDSNNGSALRKLNMSNTKCIKEENQFELDLSSPINSKLEQFGKLTELDISKSLCISTVLLPNVPLQKLNISGSYIKDVILHNQAFIETIDLTGCASIETIDVSNCERFGNLKIDKLTEVKQITFAGCKNITKVDIANCNKLERINISNCNNLSEIKINGNSSLKSIVVESQNVLINLKSIDVSMNGKLSSLNINLNSTPNVTNIDISNTAISYIGRAESYANARIIVDLTSKENANIPTTVNGPLCDLSMLSNLTTFTSNSNDTIQYVKLHNDLAHRVSKISMRSCKNLKRVFGYFSLSRSCFSGCSNLTIHGHVLHKNSRWNGKPIWYTATTCCGEKGQCKTLLEILCTDMDKTGNPNLVGRKLDLFERDVANGKLYMCITVNGEKKRYEVENPTFDTSTDYYRLTPEVARSVVGTSTTERTEFFKKNIFIKSNASNQGFVTNILPGTGAHDTNPGEDFYEAFKGAILTEFDIYYILDIVGIMQPKAKIFYLYRTFNNRRFRKLNESSGEQYDVSSARPVTNKHMFLLNDKIDYYPSGSSGRINMNLGIPENQVDLFVQPSDMFNISIQESTDSGDVIYNTYRFTLGNTLQINIIQKLGNIDFYFLYCNNTYNDPTRLHTTSFCIMQPTDIDGFFEKMRYDYNGQTAPNGKSHLSRIVNGKVFGANSLYLNYSISLYAHYTTLYIYDNIADAKAYKANDTGWLKTKDDKLNIYNYCKVGNCKYLLWNYVIAYTENFDLFACNLDVFKVYPAWNAKFLSFCNVTGYFLIHSNADINIKQELNLDKIFAREDQNRILEICNSFNIVNKDLHNEIMGTDPLYRNNPEFRMPLSNSTFSGFTNIKMIGGVHSPAAIKGGWGPYFKPSFSGLKKYIDGPDFPYEILSPCKNLISCDNLFECCEFKEYIKAEPVPLPGDLFKNNPNLTSCSHIFKDFGADISLTPMSFANCPNIKDVSYMFYCGNDRLDKSKFYGNIKGSIPVRMFWHGVNTETKYYIGNDDNGETRYVKKFRYSVPRTNISNMSHCFAGNMEIAPYHVNDLLSDDGATVTDKYKYKEEWKWTYDELTGDKWTDNKIDPATQLTWFNPNYIPFKYYKLGNSSNDELIKRQDDPMYTRKYTMEWVYDGNEEQAEMFNNLIGSDESAKYYFYKDNHTNESKYTNIDWGSSPIKPSDVDGCNILTQINYCCPPDLFLYTTNRKEGSNNINVEYIFANCGIRFTRDYYAGGDYAANDSVNISDRWKHGIYGLIPPYLLKPISTVESIEGMFMNCNRIGDYYIRIGDTNSAKCEHIPHDFFKYGNSVRNIAWTFAGNTINATASWDAFAQMIPSQGLNFTCALNAVDWILTKGYNNVPQKINGVFSQLRYGSKISKYSGIFCTAPLIKVDDVYNLKWASNLKTWEYDYNTSSKLTHIHYGVNLPKTAPTNKETAKYAFIGIGSIKDESFKNYIDCVSIPNDYETIGAMQDPVIADVNFGSITEILNSESNGQ